MDLVDGVYRTMPFELEPGVNQVEYRYLKVHDATKNEHWEKAPKRVLENPHDSKSDIEQVRYGHISQRWAYALQNDLMVTFL